MRLHEQGGEQHFGRRHIGSEPDDPDEPVVGVAHGLAPRVLGHHVEEVDLLVGVWVVDGRRIVTGRADRSDRDHTMAASMA